MMVETDQIMPITRLQKELTQTVRKMSENKEPVFVVKNNNMEAVIVPFEEYEYLSNLEDMYEYAEIGRTVKDRMKDYDPEKSVEWEGVKEPTYPSASSEVCCSPEVSQSEFNTSHE